MLTLPSILQVDNITVFPDDEDPTQFHYLPSTIELVTDSTGRPQFDFVRYDIGDDVDGEHSVSGGYLLFTVKLVADKAVLNNSVMKKLRQIVRDNAEDTMNVPEPNLTQVSFIDGTAKLFITTPAGDEQSSVDMGKPSMMGDNTLTVLAEMSIGEAALFAAVLEEGRNIAAVEYNLIMEARLRSTTVTAHISASRVRDVTSTWTTEKLESTRQNTWGKKRTSTQEVKKRATFTETLDENNLVELDIASGTSSIAVDDELKQSITDFAMGAMDKFIATEWLGVGGVLSEEDLRDTSLESVTEDFQRDFNMTLTSRDVITRPYNPSTSINTAFLGDNPEDFVLNVNLGDPHFDRLVLPVSTSFDFEKYGDYVHSVVVNIDYKGTDADGNRHEKAESFVFTKDDKDEKEFICKLGVKDEYNYSVEVVYRGGPVERREVENGTSNKRSLIASISNPGEIDTTFSCPPEVFSGEISSVEITLAYADMRNKVKPFEESFILTQEKPSFQLRKAIFAAPDKDISYDATYVFTDGAQRMEVGPIRIPATKRHETVPAPFDDIFMLQIEPMADWSDIQSIIVGVRYEDDDNDFRKSFLFNFTADSKTAQKVSFPIIDPSKTTCEVTETVVTLRSGVIEKPVRVIDTRNTIVAGVGNSTGGLVDVEIDAFEIDFETEVKRVVVSLSYEDDENDVFDSENIVLKSGDDIEKWVVGLTDKTKRDFTYDIRYMMQDRTVIRVEDVEDTLVGQKMSLSIPAPILPVPDEPEEPGGV